MVSIDCFRTEGLSDRRFENLISRGKLSELEINEAHFAGNQAPKSLSNLQLEPQKMKNIIELYKLEVYVTRIEFGVWLPQLSTHHLCPVTQRTAPSSSRSCRKAPISTCLPEIVNWSLSGMQNRESTFNCRHSHTNVLMCIRYVFIENNMLKISGLST